MTTDKASLDPRDGGNDADLERLLEERARLEERIRRNFTRTITVMFTDFKGSTALAEAEGDMASRLLIKRHHDLLLPLIAENGGVLVKTMGDGTLSWFERASDGVGAAVAFQESLKAFNRSRPGQTPIVVRIGLNSGTGIVESNDVFGDAVNVAARFEALAGPGGICISESCYDALDEADTARCRFWKMAELKGKSGVHKVFRVHWDPEAGDGDVAPEKEARAPAAARGVPRADAARGTVPSALRGLGPSFRSPLPFRATQDEPRRRPDTGWILEEREALASAKAELVSVLVRRGDTRRLSGEAYRVKGDLVVEEGGLLVIEHARLFFEPSAGIVSSGALRARHALFSATDSALGWRNVSLDPQEERMSLFEQCTFRFGKGREYRSLPGLPGEQDPRIGASFLHGGGLLVRGGSARAVPVTGCTFHLCSAHEGGGVMLVGSTVTLSDCTFEQCTAGGTGGGASCLGGGPAFRNCAFKECTAAHGGGGASIRASGASLDGCTFDRCATGYLHGGGVLCCEASPALSDCRFNGCAAVRESGGIWRDDASFPRLMNVVFTGCRPDDGNLRGVGR